MHATRTVDFVSVIHGSYVGDGVSGHAISPGFGPNDAVVEVMIFPAIAGPAVTKVSSMPSASAHLEGTGLTASLVALSGNEFVLSGAAVNTFGSTYYYAATAQLL